MPEQPETSPNTLKRAYSATEVAVILGVSRQTVHRWVAHGKIHAFDIGAGGPGRARIRITSATLDAFIATNLLDVDRLNVAESWLGVR